MGGGRSRHPGFSGGIRPFAASHAFYPVGQMKQLTVGIIVKVGSVAAAIAAVGSILGWIFVKTRRRKDA